MLAASGLKPERAAALATLLLWFDTAGLPDFGVRTLPELLDRIARGEIDVKAEGKVGPERGATAVMNGQNGPPLLILERAGQIAVEKAREFGVGLVRVRGIGSVASAAAIVAEIAIGPMAAAAVGWNVAWSSAYPSAEGLPLVLDSAFSQNPSPAILPLLIEGEWLVQAIAVTATETLAVVQSRVSAAAAHADLRLSPKHLEDHRRESFEHGIVLDEALVLDLKSRAKHLGVSEVF